MDGSAIITGMGIVSPIGVGKEDFFKSLEEGKSGLKTITGFKIDSIGQLYGGEITDFGAPVYLGTKGLRHLTRSTKMLLIAGQLALLNSFVRVRKKAFPHYNFIMPNSLTMQLVAITPDHNEGMVIGSTLGIFDAASDFDKEALRSGWRGVNPMGFTNCVFNAPAGQLAIKEKAKGPNLTISSGQCSSTDAMGIARHYLKEKQMRVVFTGGTSELGPCLYLMYSKAGLLCDSPLEFNPAGDKKSGTVLGEGSVIFTVERKEEVERTGASAIAEIEGYGTAFDPASPQHQYSADTRAAVSAIRQALNDAGIEPKDIDFVSSGLSGNEAGDELELKAIREVFGEEILIVSIKSLIGETYDASGAFQAAAAIYIMENKVFSPKYAVGITNSARYYEPRRALITSFGFSGHHSALVIKKA